MHDYALLADGERGALIGPDGALSWLCAPTWHDDVVFASLIGARGAYAVTPRARYVPGGYYEEGTLIWRSRWVTTEGVIECREALTFPGEPNRLILPRQLIAVDGPARVRVVLDPHADYGRAPIASHTAAKTACGISTPGATACAGRARPKPPPAQKA
ncbi:trehalase-like domain-containing protein [Streptomyces mirabilis]|uniref:trehalase-like domain-containing protein n=1 Tax=Streptomyces mirabilis TaxID=68239 RepID=UPI003629918C